MKELKLNRGSRQVTKDDLLLILRAIVGDESSFARGSKMHVDTIRKCMQVYFNAEVVRVRRLEKRLCEVTGTTASLVNLGVPWDKYKEQIGCNTGDPQKTG